VAIDLTMEVHWILCTQTPLQQAAVLTGLHRLTNSPDCYPSGLRLLELPKYPSVRSEWVAFRDAERTFLPLSGLYIRTRASYEKSDRRCSLRFRSSRRFHRLRAAFGYLVIIPISQMHLPPLARCMAIYPEMISRYSFAPYQDLPLSFAGGFACDLRSKCRLCNLAYRIGKTVILLSDWQRWRLRQIRYPAFFLFVSELELFPFSARISRAG
jgi:hypothetical protein